MKRIILFFILISCFAFAGGKKCFGIIPDKYAPHGFIPFTRKCGRELDIWDIENQRTIYTVKQDGDIWDIKNQRTIYTIKY